MTKEEFFSLNLDYSAYSWKELDEIAKVGDSTTRHWLKRAGREKKSRGNGSSKRKLVKNERIEKLVEEGYSTSQIAKFVGLTNRQVTCYRSKQKIGSQNDTNLSKFDKIILTDVQEQVIIGSLLGDGWIDVTNKERKYCRLCFQHSLKQFEYCIYKYSLLKDVGNYPTIIRRDDQFFNYCEDNYYQVTFRTDQNPIFEKYRNNWYTPTKKVYKPDFEKLNELGLAIWYMDDGSNPENGGCYFHCQGFLLEDVEYLKEKLKEKFNLECKVTKCNDLYVNAESYKILCNTVEKFIPLTMRYKINKGRAPFKSDKLLESLETDNQQPIANLNG